MALDTPPDLDDDEGDLGPLLPTGWPVTEEERAYVQAALEEGLAELDRGEFVSAEELDRRLDEVMREVRTRA